MIERIIIASGYENYFQTRCIRKIDRASEKNNWSAKKKTAIIESVNFENFNFTIYNSFAIYSKEELEEILNLLELINKNGKQKLTMSFISNPMIENNLQGYLENLIEGKYIVK